MKLGERVKAAFNTFKATSKNTIGTGLARDYLRYGNRKPLVEDWSQLIMNDRDRYTGYSYASINNRANSVAQMAENNLKTRATESIVKAAKAKEIEVAHPYLEIIDKSSFKSYGSGIFSNYDFWYDISTFVDLKGIYYLFALRTVEGKRVGNVQEFKLLNPYEIRRVRNADTKEIGGYVEARDGLVRTIPPQMIIEVDTLNPFSRDDSFAMTDAAIDSQFTMKQAGDYTRHSLKSNMAAPGIISTDVELEPQEFQNFVSRIRNQEKGEPLYGNGAGAITWDAMQIDMDKAALDKINEINRDGLVAVTGVSKTMLGIEQSGVTRDTAKVQKDLFISNHAMPQLRRIIDALNQDYKKYYPAQYEKNKYTIYIDSPLGTDRDAEIKDIQIRGDLHDLYDSLIAKGYDRTIAAKYAEGKLTLEELGEPTNKPITTIPAADNQDVSENSRANNHSHEIPSIHNQFDEESQGLLNQQQSLLQNAVINIEQQVVASAINKVTKNQFEEQSDVISKSDRNAYENELEIALAAFYGIILPLYAANVMNRRLAEFGKFGSFKLNNEVKKYIRDTAKKTAASHIDTILEDILKASKQAYDDFVKQEVDRIVTETGRTPEVVLEEVRGQALTGKGQQAIVSSIRKKYTNTISKTRATAIARTETNRAFTMAQFEADKQFLKQNKLEGRAYKKWITRSDNPCALCREKASEPPIPFDEPFAELGDEVSAIYEENGATKVLKQRIDFETVWAGNLHVNCGCTYQLIIE